MALFSKLKFLVVSLVVFYSVYFASYKCHQKTLLDHLTQPDAGKYLNHPFAAQHDQLCGVLNTGSSYVSPYVNKAVSFVDQHVHSHPTFKKYKVGAHLDKSKSFYSKNVAPYVHKFWQYVEVAEYHVAVKLSQLTGHAQHHYKNTVAPMAGDLLSTIADLLKNTVIPKAGEVKDQVVSSLADTYNNLPKAEKVKDQVVDSVADTYNNLPNAKEVKESVESLKDQVKAKLD